MKNLILTIALLVFVLPSEMSFGENISKEIPFFEDKDQRSRLHLEVQRFILENPEIIIEAIRLYQQKKEEEKSKVELQLLKSKSNDLFEDNYSFVGGNENGKIRIVEFIDYKCSYCKQNHKIIWDMLDRNPDVKLIVKEFPILGNQSVLAAKALLAILLSDTNEVYKAFSEMLIEYNGPININILKTFASKAGSTISDLNLAINSQQVSFLLAKNVSLAESLSIQGTPTFVIEDRIVRGFISKNEFEKLVELVREKL